MVIHLAVNAGAQVIVMTRNKAQFKTLKKLGAFQAELEGPALSGRLAESGGVGAVLNLVGNSVLLDSSPLYSTTRGHS